jgi:ferredoxin-NADP reductase
VQPNIRTQVRAARTCGDDIVTVTLERPHDYRFDAGQWYRIGLETKQGLEVRTLSHACAPSDGWLEFSTRLSGSGFKRAVSRLSPGDDVLISPAAGRLRLPDDPRLVVLSGGVGIVPVRSLMRDAIGAGRRFEDCAILFGNRDTSCELYLEEMVGWHAAGVEVVRIIEHPSHTWTGECGFITSELVERCLVDVRDRTFLVTGPPAMVAAMHDVLDELGITEGRRVVENFGPAVRRPQG